jgi:polyisoprenoid-binding protein YceI
MPSLLVLSLAAALAAAAADEPPALRPPPLPSGDYRLDTRHSELTAKVRYAGGLGHLDLRFTRLSGGLWYAPADTAMSHVMIVVDAASAASGDGGLDRVAFRALEPEKYPTITFVSDRLSLTGPEAGRLQGRLTLHGVTRPVTLRFSLADSEPAAVGRTARIRFSGGGQVSRRAFGVRGVTPFTADEVELAFDAEFVKLGPAPQRPAQ